MNIIFDGNYLFHKTYSIFETYYRNQDMSKVLAVKENQQVLLRKCIIDMCATLNRFSDIDKVAFVIDSSSWRYSLHDDYKYALTRVRDESYKYFLSVLDEFEALLRKKGIIVSRVYGAEGDDLLYVWSLYFGYILDEELVIVTGDSDITQMCTKNVSCFCNASNRLAMTCVSENVNRWERYFGEELPVMEIDPIQVLLGKVILGDTSDNIVKLLKGFGKKGFEKFINSIKPYPAFVYDNPDLVKMSQWIAGRFSEYAKLDELEVLRQVLFNLKMTWLNLSVYNNTDYQTKNGKSLLENMLDDVNEQKEKYSYSKAFTLEDFYGMLLK